MRTYTHAAASGGIFLFKVTLITQKHTQTYNPTPYMIFRFLEQTSLVQDCSASMRTILRAVEQPVFVKGDLCWMTFVPQKTACCKYHNQRGLRANCNDLVLTLSNNSQTSPKMRSNDTLEEENVFWCFWQNKMYMCLGLRLSSGNRKGVQLLQQQYRWSKHFWLRQKSMVNHD